MKVSDSPLERAKRAAGGATALARHLGLTKQAVVQWKRVPPAHVVAIEQLTGIRREELRPDVFGEGEAA